MKQSFTWLLIAALLAVFLPSTILAEDDIDFSSSVEVGAAGMSVDGEANKVMEYDSIRDKNGVNPYFKTSFAGGDSTAHLDADAEIMGDDNMQLDLDFDVQRILRLDAGYTEFNHLLSHDRLNYMDATMWDVNNKPNPSVYSEDLVPDEDFFIIHREFEINGDVVIPALPNVTLKTGFRQEEREGVEQVFGMSHCSACHVEGSAKHVKEVTQDVTIGANGRCGIVTIDYEYLTRDFDDCSGGLYPDYLVAGAPVAPFNPNPTFRTRLLFDGTSGDYLYNDTPDSEKDAHTLKGRVDLPNNTVVSGGYVHAEVESTKRDEANVLTLSEKELSSDYDSYNLRASTQLGSWRFTGYGRLEEIEGSNNTLTFFNADGTLINTIPERSTYESEEAREIVTLGGNAVYRINSGTSARLGYEYKEIDREIEEAQDTESHTVKASVRYRPTNQWNTRASYTFQKFNDQFLHPHGNKGPIDENFVWSSSLPAADKRWYEPSFYALREAEATNLPEYVHDFKVSATWAPSAEYSLTLYARYRAEENDLNFNTYKKEVISPGLNVWWMPINKLNMTMAYNFDKQKTENQMCVGWYHG